MVLIINVSINELLKAIKGLYYRLMVAVEFGVLNFMTLIGETIANE